MSETTRGGTRHPKSRRRATILAGALGLALAGVGLHLLTGCFSLGDPCVDEDGYNICNPDDCDFEDVLCREDLSDRKLVQNWLAEPGDVTICPYTGLRFEVRRDSSRVAYQGYHFVFLCSGKCIEFVEDDPADYLDDLVVEAGGPATDPDPDPALGAAIDD